MSANERAILCSVSVSQLSPRSLLRAPCISPPLHVSPCLSSLCLSLVLPNLSLPRLGSPCLALSLPSLCLYLYPCCVRLSSPYSSYPPPPLTHPTNTPPLSHSSTPPRLTAAALGPYTFRDIALTPRSSAFFDNAYVHAPYVTRVPDGSFAMYYETASLDHAHNYSTPNCTDGTHPAFPNPKGKRCMGVALSGSLDGPWERQPRSILGDNCVPEAERRGKGGRGEGGAVKGTAGGSAGGAAGGAAGGSAYGVALGGEIKANTGGTLDTADTDGTDGTTGTAPTATMDVNPGQGDVSNPAVLILPNASALLLSSWGT